MSAPLSPPEALPWQPVSARCDALGESPFWHPRERCLYWVDIGGCALRRLRPDGGEDHWPMPSEPGCIAPAASGGLVIALRDGVYRADAWGGALRRIAAAPYDTARERFNDGRADPLGRFWAGTVYEPKDAPKAALYCLDARDGAARIERKAEGAVTANGLAWSPDRTTLYWTDTPAHTVRAWDWDAPANTLSRPRVFHAFDGKPPGWQPGAPGYGGRPDGAAVDAEGHYWCAMYEGARLLRLAPDGRVVRVIEVPAACPTMPCFGGDDLRTLYLTTASAGRPDDELARWPWSGRVLAVRVDVPGLPVNFFID